MLKSKRQTETTRPRELPTWLALLVLAITIGAVYVRSLSAPWIFDDSISVLNNSSIRSLWPPLGDAARPGPLRPPVENPMSARPLVNLSFAANYALGGFDPRGYRAVNIVLHLLNSMLVWSIGWRTLRLPCFQGRFDVAARWLALGMAVIWAVHPLATEAVVYVTQRTELMAALSYLATLYSSLRYWTASAEAKNRWLVAATLACSAGAASKEVMVTAPLVVVLFDWTFISDSLRSQLERSWRLYLGLAASWLVIVALQSGTPRSESAGFTLGIRLDDWWFTQAQIFLMYLKLAVWPSPLVIHYALPHLETFGTVWPSVAAVGVLALMTCVLLMRRQPAGWLLASVFLILAPTHLVPIATEIAAERRMYLPLAALVALAVVGGYWLFARFLPRLTPSRRLRLVGGLSALAAIACFIVALNRVAMFHDPLALWQSNVDLQPYNHVAQTNLAAALSAAGGQQDAIAHYREALRIKPEFDEGRYRLGLTLAATGEFDDAIAELRTVVEHQPNAVKIRNNLGVVLFTAGRYPEAITEFEKVLELQPDFAEARENLNRARQASALPKKPE